MGEHLASSPFDNSILLNLDRLEFGANHFDINGEICLYLSFRYLTN
jgi:hypothetical protein